MNKKGAEMTIGTIVIIVLALIVLVVVALGFTTGWKNLWDKVNIFGGGGSSLSTVSQACQIACEAGDNTGFCVQVREVKGLSSSQANLLVQVIGAQNVDVNKGTAKGLNCGDLSKSNIGLITACTNEQITCK